MTGPIIRDPSVPVSLPGQLLSFTTIRIIAITSAILFFSLVVVDMLLLIKQKLYRFIVVSLITLDAATVFQLVTNFIWRFVNLQFITSVALEQMTDLLLMLTFTTLPIFWLLRHPFSKPTNDQIETIPATLG